jgi:hypothetical protein
LRQSSQERVGGRWSAADATVVPGLAVAGLAWWLRIPQLACVAVAIAVTILVRLP